MDVKRSPAGVRGAAKREEPVNQATVSAKNRASLAMPLSTVKEGEFSVAMPPATVSPPNPGPFIDTL
jgi:hypothetical protein